MDAPFKILILEDDEASLLILEELAGVLGLEPLTAATVADARNLLAGEIPQLAILDVELPDGLGTEVLAEIRERNLPISVAMFTSTHDRLKLYKCGAWKPDAMFSKPLEPLEVGGWIGQQTAQIKIRACGCAEAAT